MFVFRLLSILLFTVLFAGTATAQVSVGYMDLNSVLTQYPDMNQANEELSALERKLGADIQAFQNYLNTQIQAYQQKVNAGLSDADRSRYEDELQGLTRDLQERVRLAQEDLIRKRAELMSPALLAVEKGLRELAGTTGLDCVVQQQNEAGIPVVLFALENTNMTAAMLRHLGWPLSEDHAVIPTFDGKVRAKIGFTNIELLLANTPAVKAMEQNLEAYQQKLTRDFEKKQSDQATLYRSYMTKKESGQASADELLQLERTLLKQDNELNQYPQYADALLQERRTNLMQPVLDRAQTAIDKIAEENGFTLILNQTASSGVSTIVHGPENADITAHLFKALDIPGGTAPGRLTASQNIKMGYINVEKVFAGMPDIKEVNEEVQGRFQTAINAIAAEKEYAYILNQTSASNILYLNPAYDETQNVLARLKK